MESVWSVSKLSTESVGSRRELVANSVHTADSPTPTRLNSSRRRRSRRCVLGNGITVMVTTPSTGQLSLLVVFSLRISMLLFSCFTSRTPQSSVKRYVIMCETDASRHVVNAICIMKRETSKQGSVGAEAVV